MKKIIFLIIIICFLGGCYSYDDIDNLALISSIIIDYKDDEYIINLEYIKPNKNNDDKSYFISSEGSSIDEAINLASSYIDKKLYFIDLNVLLVTEDVINHDLDALADYITRNNLFTFNFNLLIIDKVDDIIAEAKENNLLNGNYIKKIISNKNNNIVSDNYGMIIEKYINKSSDVIIPYGYMKDKQLVINKACVVKDKKIAKILNYQEVQFYNLLTNNRYNIIYKLDNGLIIKLINGDSKIDFDSNSFVFNIKVVGNFSEASGFDIDDKDDIKKIKNLLNNKLKNELNVFLLDLSKNNYDLFGMRKKYFIKTRKEITNLSDIKININIESELIKDGLTAQSIGEQNEKENGK